MSAFRVQVSSAARLAEARPSAKTNTIEIVFFILLPFQSLSLRKQGTVNIFMPLEMR
jgi:hypothetical protein